MALIIISLGVVMLAMLMIQFKAYGRDTEK